MPTPTTQRSRALALLGRRPILRLKDFAAQDVAPETLARLVREGMIVRVARGLYQRANASVDAGHSLAEAAALVPKGVVCLTSALQFHELTLQMPSEVWMAIDRTAWRPRIEYPPIRIVRFSGTALTDGVKHHRIDGVEVAITDPSRTHRGLLPLSPKNRDRCGARRPARGPKTAQSHKRPTLAARNKDAGLVDSKTLCRGDGCRWRVNL